MPYQIRHKASGQIVKLRSGKSVWAKPAHAKAAYLTSGLYRWGSAEDEGSYKYYGLSGPSRFDDQDQLELVEVSSTATVEFERAVQLLQDVLPYVPTSEPMFQAVQDFLKEVK